MMATWPQAWRTNRDAVTGHLADAAGAEVLFFDSEQDHGRPSPPQAGQVSTPDKNAAPGPVADAVARHGATAVRYALARTSAPREEAIIRQLDLPLDLDNPFVAVRYAHADAASTLRWAADLALAAGQNRPILALRCRIGSWRQNSRSWTPCPGCRNASRRRPGAGARPSLPPFLSTWPECGSTAGNAARRCRFRAVLRLTLRPPRSWLRGCASPTPRGPRCPAALGCSGSMRRIGCDRCRRRASGHDSGLVRNAWLM